MKSASPLVYLGIGAAIATGALFLMSQAVPPTSHSSSSAIPRKNVVNIFERFTAPISLAPGAEMVVYTVPSDRWFTVTGCALSTGLVSQSTGWFSSWPSDSLSWGENYNGSFARKGLAWNSSLCDGTQIVGGGNGGVIGGDIMGLPFSPGGDSNVGWVFRPGSQVVIRNTGTTPTTPAFFYSLTGYISRD